MNVGQLQWFSGNSATNSVNNHHLTNPFEGGMRSFKRQGACVIGKALDYSADICRITKGAHIEHLYGM